MFIQLNLKDMYDKVYIINSDHIVSIASWNDPSDHIQKYRIYLTSNREIYINERVHTELLSKLNQAYIEII